MPVDHLVGTVLASRYFVERRLGRGAMGTVYRARHVKIDRFFAIKVLHPRMLASKTIVGRFAREARLSGQLQHPNIAAVVDVGETADGLQYLVMEYAPGVELATMIEGKPLDREAFVRIARQLCAGLHHAHEHGVAHRDFKPDNVIVSPARDTARIIDFGIALATAPRSTRDSERLTEDGQALGTPGYMAPEQASGGRIDHRADLYALGVTCYEMLTGALPYEGTGVALARATIEEPLPAMQARAPFLDIDPLLEAFTAALMHKSPDDRPASAAAAGELLDHIERDRPGAAKTLGVDLAAVARRRRRIAMPPLR